MQLYSPPTQHPDGLLPVVGGLGGAAVVVAPVGGPPDVAGVGAPDGGDHAGVEEDEEHHRDQEEEEEGHLVDWVPLRGEGYTGDRAPLVTGHLGHDVLVDHGAVGGLRLQLPRPVREVDVVDPGVPSYY